VALQGQHEHVAVGSQVQAVVDLGRMPSDDEEPDEARIESWVNALDAIEGPLSDEEAAALLDCFPPDDSTVYGVAWSLLHAIESAPYGASFLQRLDDR
jgi:hypothetical protein